MSASFVCYKPQYVLKLRLPFGNRQPVFRGFSENSCILRKEVLECVFEGQIPKNVRAAALG